jgi:AcrR family transcriptional regulator
MPNRRPRPRTRAEQTAANGRRLADAARAVFLRRGYHGATLDQVAAAAGLTKGAVYARFAGKAALFLSLLEERVAERCAAIRALPPLPAAEIGDALFRQWLQRVRGDEAWSLLVVEFRVAAARDRALNARYAALHERLIDAVVERLEEGARRGALAPAVPPREAARIGLSLATGVLLERAAAGDGLSPATAVLANGATYAALLRPVAARRAPRRRR